LGTIEIDLGTIEIDLGTIEIDLGTIEIGNGTAASPHRRNCCINLANNLNP
jgi:hypothetical protein